MSTGMVSGDVLHAQHDGGGRIPVRVFPTERDVRAIYKIRVVFGDNGLKLALTKCGGPELSLSQIVRNAVWSI